MIIPEAISPVGQHIFSAVVALLAWPVLRLLAGRKHIPDEEWAKYRMQVRVIMLMTAVGFCGILVSAFNVGGIIGYQLWVDELRWMDPEIKRYEAVYEGEWLAYAFLYLFPIAAAIINIILLKKPGSRYFRIAFMRTYPAIIFISYISMGVAILVTDTSTKRKQITADQYVPPKNL